MAAAPGFFKGQKADAVLADKACDSDTLREQIKVLEAEAVIPARRNRKVCIPHDINTYKHRS
jgi:putative transposase